MTLQEAFDNFIMSRRLADLSEKTIYNYTLFVAPMVRYFGADFNFSNLTQELVDKYLFKLVSGTYSRSTRATYVRHVKIFLCWCESKYGACYDAKQIKVPKSTKREVKIYSDDDVRLIFNSIKADNGWLVARNKCIIALMYDSGLRQSEVCSLRSCWVSDDRLIVHGKGDKERCVPLGALSRRFLSDYLAICPFHTDMVFVSNKGDSLTCDAVKHMVFKLARKLPFALSSHKLRHNFATNYCLDQYERNGQIDIYQLMYIMGHEEIETTQRYLHFAYEIISSRNHISHLDKIAL